MARHVPVIPLNCLPAQDHFYRHFGARAIGLILVPFVIYLSFFWVHFAVLTRSGPGDSFMSPEFQETLSGSEMLLNSQGTLYPHTLFMLHG